MEMIEAVGIVNERHLADLLAKQFTDEKVFAAGGKAENTVERARVVPFGYRNTITGWMVKIDRREHSEIGKPWPPL